MKSPNIPDVNLISYAFVLADSYKDISCSGVDEPAIDCAISFNLSTIICSRYITA